MKKGLILITIILAIPVVMAAGAAVTGSFSDGGGILYTEPVKSVLFSHKIHADEKRISCNRCHSGLFEMEALKVQQKKDFTMESLYKGKYCGACHNGKAAFASDTQCARCHVRADETKARFVKGKATTGGAVYKTAVVMGKGKSAVRFNHATHISQAKCNDCHSDLFKIKKGSNRIAMNDHGSNKYCFACHDGRKAFTWNDCSRCHAAIPAPPQAIPFGTGAKAVFFNHKSHSGVLQCGSCHTKLFPYKKGGEKITFADHSAGKNCFACHTGKGKGAAFYDCNRCHKDRAAAAPSDRKSSCLTCHTSDSIMKSMVKPPNIPSEGEG
jgi:c(7)-type cytochrome triheme protein